ncbi:MAG: heavy metal-translocating P-type ATPase, Cd/Co/Hg/Pb/Zn-transporting [Candidatus Saccharibacteria bacterium]|nr:heavy metal-translocating P-type ATPase, Cd/Co/Hg/Pb/Zn-transporting [Candidatus Saccharibacteria bacterium]
MKRLLRFVRRYKEFCFALLSSAVALGLDLAGFDKAAHIILIIVASVVLIPLLWGMVEDLRNGKYGVDILAATAIITALVMGEYWAAIVIVLMLTGGESLEDYAEHRAKSELDALLSRAPQKAHVLRKKSFVDVTVKEVKVADTIEVRPGEVVPVDCEVIEGTTSVDEASLTGESLPQLKKPGDKLLSGTVNLDGAITAKAIHSAADSQYQQIIKLVKAADNQSPFVRLADRYSVPFTIIAFVIAGGAWLISGESERFLEVLVVATPCPLILAAPIAVISGISRAARNGIIVKNGSALERLAAVRTIAFDKTGTLTHGTPEVDGITTYSGFKKVDVLSAAATVEQSSNHVLATAITNKAIQQKIKLTKAKHVKELPGHGVQAQVGGKQIMVGRLGMIDEYEIIVPPTFSIKKVQQTAAFVAIDHKLAGIISFNDEVRDNSKATLQRLNGFGIRKFLMVTGDNQTTAKKIAKQLGISDVTAEALPADKLHAIDAIKERPVAFVGDGVNDAPVLTAAEVGIALGAKGSTAASESADVVIMQDDISRVADAFAIARRTFRIAQQSILIGIGLSIALMLIFATGRFQPLYGALIQEVVDIVVIFNALRAHGSKL